MVDKNESTYKDMDTENLCPKKVIDNFDLFRQEFPDVDVHKNPFSTLLYMEYVD